jgi:hypothetical protein
MSRAKEVWKNRIREARAPRLFELDVEYLRANEAGDEVKKAEVVAKKQRLRDLPQDPQIEGASTPEELKSIWFSELPPPSLPVVVEPPGPPASVEPPVSAEPPTPVEPPTPQEPPTPPVVVEPPALEPPEEKEKEKEKERDKP